MYLRGEDYMRIAIDGRGINWYHGTGIGTYTENLVKNLLQIDKKNHYLLYWSGPDYDKYKRANTMIHMCSKRYHRFFEESYFPYTNDINNIDIHHIPQNGIGLYKDMNCKKVVTIHDLIPYIMPETVGKGYLTKFMEEMPKIIKESSAIITVSEHSKNDILKFFPNAEGKVFVTYLAPKDIYKPLRRQSCVNYLKRKYSIDTPFLLYVGGFSSRKNVKGLILSFYNMIKIFDKPLKLVVTGSLKDDGDNLLKLCHDLNLDDKIIFTGFIPEEDLPIFYNGCEIFIYPSLYEGFGLPPLEAMSCGIPVITSNTTSIPEVVSDGGILIDPFDENSLTKSMITLLTDEKLNVQLRFKALNRAKNFSWLNTSFETLNVYNWILNNS